MKFESFGDNNERKLKGSIEKKIEKVTEEMERRGFAFEISRTPDEFVIKTKDRERELPAGKIAEDEIAELEKSGIPFESRREGDKIILSFFRETHVPIWDKIPVGKKEAPVEKVIKAFIMNPVGSVEETINSPDFNEEIEGKAGEDVAEGK